jgi:N-carbamoyl-L-amino-acid hydrolase
VERFKQRFDAFSEIGRSASGAMNRPFGSPADLEARAWLVRLAEEAGFEVYFDAVANLWGVRPGQVDGPAIVLGSHHDSVPDGGRFDGPLGVLMAIEVIQSLQEAGYQNALPLSFVSFTAEEPNPFDLSTLGSRTGAGRRTEDQLNAAADWNGRPLWEALTAAGGGRDRLAEVRKSRDDIAAFLELHIEQGRRLESAQIPIGVVSGICGIYRETVTVAGEANHAGTTQLSDRRDALLATSEMLLAIEQKLQAADNPELIATVGRLTVTPNAANIIPGECQWILEIRGGDMAEVYGFRDACMQVFADIAARRGVTFRRDLMLDQQPQPMSDEVIQALQQAASALHLPYMNLASMAGHDATHIASFTRAGMVFVPSLGGKSHCKEEASRMEDIEQAFYVLAAATMALDTAIATEEGYRHGDR